MKWPFPLFFSLIFLIPNIYRTRGKAGDDKVYGDLVKTLKMEDKKSLISPCLHDAYEINRNRTKVMSPYLRLSLL
jgi:hypothetical protein